MSAENQSFLELLQSHRRGEVVASADEHLRELLEAIRDTGTKGSITVKFDFAMNKAGQLEIDPDISIKKPRRKLAKGIAYLTDDAELRGGLRDATLALAASQQAGVFQPRAAA